MIVLQNIKKSILRKLAFKIDSSYFYWQKAQYMYEDIFGEKPQYNNPILLRDKLMWLTRYWQHPIKTICADKYAVRNYVKEKGCGDLLVPLIAVYKHPKEIDFSELPSQFVLKCNHGSGYNIIVLNKEKKDIKDTSNNLKKWFHHDYYKDFCEIHYKGIKRRIICEKLLSEEAPTEYQCWCVNGQPESILVCRKNFDGSYDSFSCDLNFNQLFDRIDEKPSDVVLEKPIHLNEIIKYAKILSQDFPFVRADFYEVDGKVYFAELTFTPNGNYLTKYKESFHKRLGEKLILPEKYS